MPKYEVTFSIGHRGQSGTGAFIGESTLQHQKITVEATGATTAQRLVENMFRGPEHCMVGTVWESR